LCKAPDLLGRDVGIGFPSLAERMDSTGRVRAVVLFIDFNDAPASLSPADVFAMLDPGAEELYAALSYGRMQFELVPHLVWLRMSGPGSAYANTTFDGELAVLQEAANLADAEVDFSGFDMIVAMSDPNTSPFPIGPAFTGGELPYGVGGIEVDGVTINNGTVSGQDLNYWGYAWLNHETGHLMGLADLYLYGTEDYLRYIRDWSIMGQITGAGQELFGWERWQLDWLADYQIACFPEGGTATLTAIEVEGGVKIIVVPRREGRAVVVESRRALGYDLWLPEGGALVYTIDAAIASGEGPLRVQPETAADLMFAPLAAGESLTVDSVTITVLQAGELTDTVQVRLE
jgi:M6 family metalloprotease-like protein